MMKIDVLTLFPDMFTPLNISMMKEAQASGALQLNLHNFRQYAVNKHGHVDDYPYGGGAGMLLRVEPIVNTLETLQFAPDSKIILVDPTGEPFSQEIAQEWSNCSHLVFICGHYEGFDERIRDYVTQEVSLGDYVITNGEIAATVMIDATVRLLPEVLGNNHSIVEESYQRSLLEHPQYTRPRDFRGKKVPEVLLSGHHENIRKWQAQEAIRKTYQCRPDLLEHAQLTKEEQQFLEEIRQRKEEEA